MIPIKEVEKVLKKNKFEFNKNIEGYASYFNKQPELKNQCIFIPLDNEINYIFLAEINEDVEEDLLSIFDKSIHFILYKLIDFKRILDLWC
jgi:hypothetical protein